MQFVFGSLLSVRSDDDPLLECLWTYYYYYYLKMLLSPDILVGCLDVFY